MGLLFVAAVSFGALPGMLALVFYSTGILGKLFLETRGEKKELIEAIQFTGVSSMQIF